MFVDEAQGLDVAAADDDQFIDEEAGGCAAGGVKTDCELVLG